MRYISSFHGILEALRSGVQGVRLLVVDSRGGAGRGNASRSGAEGQNPDKRTYLGPRVRQILDIASKRGLAVDRVDQAELEKLDPENRGILLEIESKERPEQQVSLEEFLGSDAREALVLVLDHIEDPQNLGAILRSADAFGADLVVLPTKRTSPASEAVVRASAGASAWVSLCRVQNLADALGKLKLHGYWIYAADMDGDPLQEVEFPEKTCFVLGNEGSGLSRLLTEKSDTIVSIPMSGHVESLNVSVSAAICMYAYRTNRQRRGA